MLALGGSCGMVLLRHVTSDVTAARYDRAMQTRSPLQPSEPSQTAIDSAEIVPARMINEYLYCPRLAYLEWVESDFADNAFTVEGRLVHRRVDRGGGGSSKGSGGGGSSKGSSCDEASSDAEPTVTRSVLLEAPQVGIVARIDVLEQDGKVAVPVDYKRGRPPKVKEGAYLPERAQICAQALVLREHGYQCDEGFLYFGASRQRVRVPIDEALVRDTLGAVRGLRRLARRRTPPPALGDRRRCFGCSLVGICLPDETDALTGRQCRAVSQSANPRPIFAMRDDAVALHVHQQGGRIGHRKGLLRCETRDGDVEHVRLRDTSHVAIYGNVQLSTQAIRALRERNVPVTFSSYGGWFYGMLAGLPHGNVRLRQSQFRLADRDLACLRIARALVNQKIRNQRTLLRRNGSRNKDPDLQQALNELKIAARKAEQAGSLASLLGIEGSAARRYFGCFATLLSGELNRLPRFAFDGRNRRPPRDPVNAILSFLYALLTKELTIVLAAVGFDPNLGFYHRVRAGRPALALDLMEPFRPLLADSVALRLVNSRVLQVDDFIHSRDGVALKTNARKRVIELYEQRLSELVTHPVFGYRISYRRVLEVHARLFARYLSGELHELPTFVTR
jgi:CRISPR-associated protein Cas1